LLDVNRTVNACALHALIAARRLFASQAAAQSQNVAKSANAKRPASQKKSGAQLIQTRRSRSSTDAEKLVMLVSAAIAGKRLSGLVVEDRCLSDASVAKNSIAAFRKTGGFLFGASIAVSSLHAVENSKSTAHLSAALLATEQEYLPLASIRGVAKRLKLRLAA
jgi:hypothetical protein